MIDPNRLAGLLSDRFRLALAPEFGRVAETEVSCVRAVDVPAPNGFVIRVSSGWRSVDAEFVPDDFAGELIRHMGIAAEPARRAFGKAANAFAATGSRISLRVNQSAVADFGALPAAPWTAFDLRIHRMSVASTQSDDALFADAVAVATPCLALALALIPLEDDEACSLALFETGLPEGATIRVEVNRYERNPVNRATCIATHGSLCQACRLDFGRAYGPLGEGYIEVHHSIPVSMMGAGYVVDPVNDLVPLCANCHAMIHRRDPPLSLPELRAILAAAGK